MPVTIDGTTGISGPASGLTDLNASNLSTGTVPDARFPATLPAASGANLTSLNASNLSTGTVGTARLATGTANSTTYLRGDQTWATVSTTPTTAQVLSATAGASLGEVGTYALLSRPNYSGSNITQGSTYAGSALRYAGGLSAGDSNNSISGTAPAGTWRAMGFAFNRTSCGIFYENATIFLRIS